MATKESQIPAEKPTGILPAEVPMTDDERKALIQYLDEELGCAEWDRQATVDRWIKFQELYRTPVPTTAKEWPFKGASQITVPLAKMSVNVIAPRITDELLRQEPPWSLRSSHEDVVFERVSKHGEDFLGMYARRRVRLDRKIEDHILEGCKLGTAVYEVVMDNERRETARYAEDGITIQPVIQARSVGPQVRNIPVEDLWYKYGFVDPQEMPWIGKLVRLTKRQVEDRIATNRFREVEARKMLDVAKETVTTSTRQVTAEVESYEKTEPNYLRLELFDVYELYVYWPIRVKDASGKEHKVTADLLLWYNREARALLRVQLNPWWHGRRPILPWQYTPVEYRLVGEGIAEQVEQFQEEISAMHRQRLDNATLAGMRMVLVSKTVEGLQPGDPLYPGKVLRAINPDTDAKPFQLTEIYPSTAVNENLSMQFVERVTGINEAILGQALPVPRTTATAQTIVSEESRQRFNLTIRRARRVIEEAGEMIYDLFHQFGTGGLAEEWLGPTRGAIVETLFRFPRERVMQGVSVHVKATTSRINKPAEMQANLQLFNLMVQLHERLFQLPIPQEALPVVAHGLVSSANRFAHRILENFDIPDPEELLLTLSVLERIFPAPPGVSGQAALLSQLQALEAQINQTGLQLRGEVGAGVAEGLQGLGDLVGPYGRTPERGTAGGSRLPNDGRFIAPARVR